jgi:antitoxin MazE6
VGFHGDRRLAAPFGSFRHSPCRKEPLYKVSATRWIIALEAQYNHGYTTFMKTAISIPDSLFEEADRLAKRRGWSRSELYANAVTAYVNNERFSGVREKLDAVYGNNEEDSAIDPFLADAQARSLPREKW